MISFFLFWGLTIKMAKSSKHYNKHDTIKLWLWLRCRWHQKCFDARWYHYRIDTVCWNKHVRLWNGRNSTLGWIRRLRWREETALNQKYNICDRNGDVRDFEEKGNVDGVSDLFDKERWWSWRTHRSRTPGLGWWRTLHKALPAEEWVLLGSPSSFLRILLYTLIGSDKMTLCFWLKSEGEISKCTHHMKAGEDIQVGDRDPESKKSERCID